MKILIVDDSPVETLFLSLFLEEKGSCDTAGNGNDAVEMVRKKISDGEHYDLICLDIVMPGMDGHETLKIIRELETAGNAAPARIFMITSCDSPEQMMEAIATGGCDDYIVKPVISGNLSGLLAKHGLIEESK